MKNTLYILLATAIILSSLTISISHIGKDHAPPISPILIERTSPNEILLSVKKFPKGQEMLKLNILIPRSEHVTVAIKELKLIKAKICSTKGHLPSSFYTYSIIKIREYRILSIKLHFMISLHGKLVSVDSISLAIKWRNPVYSVDAVKYSPIFEAMVKDLVCNPENLDEFYIFQSEEEEKIDYIIITDQSLNDTCEIFLQHKIERKNVTAKVYTVQFIESTVDGYDIPEKIRNFIRQKYNESGVEWVLLIGDNSTIPFRYVLSNETRLPTDYYYAALDGNWDADGDHIYGEPEDEVDWGADVFVGRIPFNDINIVNDTLKNIILYEMKTNLAPWMERILLAGGILRYENETGSNLPKLDSATVSDFIADVLPEGFSHLKMYEENGLSPSAYPHNVSLSYSSFSNEFAKGYAYVNIIGIGSGDTVYRKVWTSDDGDNVPEPDELSLIAFVDTSTPKNNLYHQSVIYCLASMTCAVDLSANCLGSYMISGYMNGSVAFIGPTRNICFPDAWNQPGDGSALDLNFLFWKLAFSRPLEARKPGMILYYSKIEYVLNLENITLNDRINLYTLILLGDPEASIPIDDDTEGPQIYAPASSGDVYDNVSMPYMLQINVTDPSGVFNVCFRYKYGENGTWSPWMPYMECNESTYRYYISFDEWSNHTGCILYWQVMAVDDDNDVPYDRATSISEVFVGGMLADDDTEPPQLISIEYDDVFYDGQEPGYTVVVKLYDKSGISSVKLGFFFEDYEMITWISPISQVNYTYTFMIPKNACVTHIRKHIKFMIEAIDADNDRPNDAETFLSRKYYTALILDDDETPPTLVNMYIEESGGEGIVDSSDYLTISVECIDESGIGEITLHYMYSSEGIWRTAVMYNIGGDTFSCRLFNLKPFDTLSFYIIAYDNDTDREGDQLSTNSTIYHVDIYGVLTVYFIDQSGSPVENVLIKLLANETVVSTAYTNVTGHAILRIKDAGIYTIQACVGPVEIARETISVVSEEFIVMSGELYTVTANVLDADGAPLSNFKIEAFINGERVFSISSSESTVYIKPVPRSELYIVVTYYGKVVGSKLVNVERSMSIEITCEVSTLIIKVENLLGEPMSNVVVKIDELGEIFSTGDDGVCIIGQLPHGTYTITVQVGPLCERKTIIFDESTKMIFKVPLIAKVTIGNFEIYITLIMVVAIIAVVAVIVAALILLRKRYIR